MKRGLLILLLILFSGMVSAQDASGLGGLPQGKGGVNMGRAKSASPSSLPVYAFGARTADTSLLGLTPDSTGDAPRASETTRATPHGGCENSSNDLCFDSGDNHIVYRPARALMPKFAGLTPENISVNRHGVRLKYSFP